MLPGLLGIALLAVTFDTIEKRMTGSIMVTTFDFLVDMHCVENCRFLILFTETCTVCRARLRSAS